MTTAPPDTGDAPLAPSPATTAAAERQRIFAECESHTWRDKLLKPWNAERQSQFSRIVALDLAGGDLDDLPGIRSRFEAGKKAALAAGESFELELGDVVDFDHYVPTAAKALFIASQPPEAWFHLRAHPLRLIQHIEAWTAEHIAPDEAQEACFLVQRILSEHRALMPMHRPRKATPGTEGN